ncbi:MAG: transcriptional regulator, partial [Thermoproteota archaeon]
LEMYLPCESIGKSILPVFRFYIAKELIKKYNYTQVEVAEKLGTTQAAVSQYISLKRGHGSLKKFEDALPLIQKAANQLARDIASRKINANELAPRFCELCLYIQKRAKKRRPLRRREKDSF